ncbi:MAG: LysR family transcriptional regulator [Sphingobium sp.]
MHLRFIEYFTALARERHFTRAAEACGVSQPTLSAGIVALEEALGKRLIQRERRFVGLTPEGQAMLPWAQRLLADHEALRQAVSGEGGQLTGEFRLGVIPAAIPAVGLFTARIRQAHPALCFSIRSMTSREIERSLADFELDAGLTYLSGETPAQLLTVPIYTERYGFATRRDGLFGGLSQIGWEQAAASPLCLLHTGMQNRRILDAWLASIGLSVEPEMIADSYATLLTLVESAGMNSILPDSFAAMLPVDGHVTILPFVKPAPPNRIGLVVFGREPVPSVARAALRAAREISGEKIFAQS